MKKKNNHDDKEILKGPGASKIVELSSAREDHYSDFSIAQDRELLRFLQQSVPSLRKRHLSARRVIDPPYHYFPSPHSLSSAVLNN